MTLYLISFLALGVSVWFDRQKTVKALQKGSKALLNILPDFLAVILLIGISLAFISPEFISQYLGNNASLISYFGTSILGSVTLIPGLISFPLAKSLLDQGASVQHIGLFISTLMMVGIVTIPLEVKYFNKKITFYRNGIAFIASFVIAYLLGVIV